MFKTTQKKGIFYNVPVSIFTFKDLSEYVKKSINIWKASPVIWDFRESFLSPESEAHAIIKAMLYGMKDIANVRSGSKTAFVLSNDYEFGMFRMLCALTQCLEYPFELETFKILSDAEHWVSKISLKESSTQNESIAL